MTTSATTTAHGILNTSVVFTFFTLQQQLMGMRRRRRGSGSIYLQCGLLVGFIMVFHPSQFTTTMMGAEGAIVDILDFNDDTIECASNFSSCTLMMGNPAALELLRARCAADPTCSTRFGQDLGPNLPTFTFLLTATFPGNISTLCLEDFFTVAVCNKTVVDSNLDLGVQQLLVQTNAASPCGINEFFVLNSSGTGGSCRCLPDKTCDVSSTEATSTILIIIFVFVVIASMAAFGFSLWREMGRRRSPTVPIGRFSTAAAAAAGDRLAPTAVIGGGGGGGGAAASWPPTLRARGRTAGSSAIASPSVGTAPGGRPRPSGGMPAGIRRPLSVDAS